MPIGASEVKELRERTGAGMMECKKALIETGGDMEAAVLYLKKSGQAKADRKSGRVAAEGRIAIAVDGQRAAMVEVNSETDFVAKDDNFANFADAVADCLLQGSPEDVESLVSATLADGKTIEAARTELVAKVGENISVRRFARLAGADRMGYYVHKARIGVLVSLANGSNELGLDIAMHIAATNPAFIDADAVPAEILEQERRMFRSQAKNSGKPPEIIEKMVEGRLAKYLKEITLLGQPFVKDNDLTVGKLLESAGSRVVEFVRFELGEGIEKKQENFADEVMAQVHRRA